MSAQNLITPMEAAKRLGLDQRVNNPIRMIQRMARDGDLVSVKVRKFIMIDPDSVDAYITGHTSKYVLAVARRMQIAGGRRRVS